MAEPIVEDARAANAGGGGLLLSSSLITQVSLYYHIGLSYLMIRKYVQKCGGGEEGKGWGMREGGVGSSLCPSEPQA